MTPDGHDRGPSERAGISLAGLPTGRTLVMGILNVTPDSFSDGGRHFTKDAAIDHALTLVRQGADIVDIGGESTRPGAEPVDPAEEQRRILDVIRGLAAEGVVVSVDTIHPETAAKALEAGAAIVNDVSGMRLSGEMIRVVAEAGVPYIVTHARGDSLTMDSLAHYRDTVAEVRDELWELREQLVAGGVRPEKLILDPGLGFAKTGSQDWELLAGLDQLTGLGHPVLVAASRKRFVGAAVAEARGLDRPVPPGERDVATSTVSALSAAAGAWAVRVHDVVGTVDALGVLDRWNSASEGHSS